MTLLTMTHSIGIIATMIHGGMSLLPSVTIGAVGTPDGTMGTILAGMEAGIRHTIVQCHITTCHTTIITTSIMHIAEAITTM